jgi:hypothetical protein
MSFVSQHAAAGDELFAGTAEAYLECDTSSARPGTAVVTYVVESNTPGASGMSGTQSVKVVGPPANVKVEVSPASGVCGTPRQATATVTDSTGQPVSDGTQVFFTTTSSTGSQGGAEGAQGGVTTTNGVASITLSLNPLDAGTHTVSARTGGNDLTGAPVKVVSNNTTIECTLAASASIQAPRTGTGPSVQPPNTGDAGLLATDNGSSWALFALTGGIFALTLAGVAARKLAR